MVVSVFGANPFDTEYDRGPSNTNVIDGLTDDPDLNPIRGDADFKRLVTDAQAAHKSAKKPK